MKSDYELSDFLIESPYEMIDEDRWAIRSAIGGGMSYYRKSVHHFNLKK